MKKILTQVQSEMISEAVAIMGRLEETAFMLGPRYLHTLDYQFEKLRLARIELQITIIQSILGLWR